jgi:uncharacterized membrane protein YqjE
LTNETPPPAPGLFGSLRRVLDTLLGTAQLRLELFGSELELEKLRLFDALLRAAIGLLLLGLALVMALAFLVLLFQPQYRLAAVGVLALGLGAGAAALLVQARRGLQAGDGGPFALTLGELRRDRAALGTQHEASGPAPVSPPPPASPSPPAPPPR